MKRILLTLSLLSLAAQTPVHAESKILAAAETVLKSSETVLKSPFVLVGRGVEGLANGVAYGVKAVEPITKAIEPAVTSAAHVIGNGLVTAGNGFLHVSDKYPLTIAAALAVASFASFSKGLTYHQEGKKEQCDSYIGAGLFSGMAAIIYSSIAFDKYCGPIRF